MKKWKTFAAQRHISRSFNIFSINLPMVSIKARHWLDLPLCRQALDIRAILVERSGVIATGSFALNENMPFDRFTVMQLAGDGYPPGPMITGLQPPSIATR
ncbi:MAG: hypothetical protein WKF73_14135 [Nocardioidaceae bacterium]